MSTVPDRVLSRPALMAAREAGQILIEPYDPRYVKGCSVDVRLGEWFYEEQVIRPTVSHQPRVLPPRDLTSTHLPSYADQYARFAATLSDPNADYVSMVPMLNPWDPASVSSMWGSPKKAQPLGWSLPGIPADLPVIVMPPRSVFLAHTQEFIGSLHPEITFMVKARSSTGRNRIRVCACAGWGDQGYANRITLELANDSEYRSVILVPGRRVGQIVFIPTTPLPEDEMYFKSGKYQKESAAGKSYEELCAGWNPEEMLPRQWADWELQES